jgi:hypothetical protein
MKRSVLKFPLPGAMARMISGVQQAIAHAIGNMGAVEKVEVERENSKGDSGLAMASWLLALPKNAQDWGVATHRDYAARLRIRRKLSGLRKIAHLEGGLMSTSQERE